MSARVLDADDLLALQSDARALEAAEQALARAQRAYQFRMLQLSRKYGLVEAISVDTGEIIEALPE